MNDIIINVLLVDRQVLIRLCLAENDIQQPFRLFIAMSVSGQQRSAVLVDRTVIEEDLTALQRRRCYVQKSFSCMSNAAVSEYDIGITD